MSNYQCPQCSHPLDVIGMNMDGTVRAECMNHGLMDVTVRPVQQSPGQISLFGG